MSGLLLPPGARRRVREQAPQWKDSNLLPPWVDITHPEAKRGTELLRAFDPQLKACFDPNAGFDFATGRRLHPGCFAIWGMSQTQGRVPILLLETADGRPQSSPIPWEWWIGKLHEMREGPLACERAQAQNEERQGAAQTEEDARLSEVVGLFAEGAARNRTEDIRDVADTVNRQVYGQKPAPRGQKIYLPGDPTNG